MIVVAILGILSSIATFRYADLLRKSHEGAVLGNLGVLRSALSIYYADMEGQYPAALASLTGSSKYIKLLPAIRPPSYHMESRAVVSQATDDTNGWAYNDDPDSTSFGKLWVNCSHTDTKGSVWTSY